MKYVILESGTYISFEHESLLWTLEIEVYLFRSYQENDPECVRKCKVRFRADFRRAKVAIIFGLNLYSMPQHPDKLLFAVLQCVNGWCGDLQMEVSEVQHVEHLFFFQHLLKVCFTLVHHVLRKAWGMNISVKLVVNQKKKPTNTKKVSPFSFRGTKSEHPDIITDY